jgi:hypothetical protein
MAEINPAAITPAHYSAKVDLYSLGIIAVELWTPFQPSPGRYKVLRRRARCRTLLRRSRCSKFDHCFLQVNPDRPTVSGHSGVIFYLRACG